MEAALTEELAETAGDLCFRLAAICFPFLPVEQWTGNQMGTPTGAGVDTPGRRISHFICKYPLLASPQIRASSHFPPPWPTMLRD
jgi:hypothetical protein